MSLVVLGNWCFVGPHFATGSMDRYMDLWIYGSIAVWIYGSMDLWIQWKSTRST